jgi:hypothetical protein
MLYAAGNGDLESVRVLLAADPDWKLGTDPKVGWFLEHIEDLTTDMKDMKEDRYNHTDLDAILRLLTDNQRNI